MEFYGHVAAFLMILGFRLFWLGGLETWLPETLKKIILWIGEYSMGIFLTHWLVIASFSCWFYSIYSEAGEKLAIWLSALLFMGAHGSLSQWLPALAAGLALGIVTFYTGTLRWAILIHLCNNIIAWVTTYFPSPLTAILLPVGLLILGGIALLRLRRMPRWAPARGNPRLGVSVPLVLALLLLLGNALFPVV